MLIGYARVSTDDQDFALQEDAWKDAGCERIFYDKTAARVRNQQVFEKPLTICEIGKIHWSSGG